MNFEEMRDEMSRPFDGGQIVPPAYLRVVLPGETPEQRARWHREAAERRLREDIRWASLTPTERTLERIAKQRKHLAREVRARRRELGLRIAGLTEEDIGGDW